MGARKAQTLLRANNGGKQSTMHKETAGNDAQARRRKKEAPRVLRSMRAESKGGECGRSRLLTGERIRRKWEKSGGRIEIWRRAVAIKWEGGFPPLRQSERPQAKRRAALRGWCLGAKKKPRRQLASPAQCEKKKKKKNGDDAAGNNKKHVRPSAHQLIRVVSSHACASAVWIAAAPTTRSLGRSVDCEKNRAGEGGHIKSGRGRGRSSIGWHRQGEKKKNMQMPKRKKANRD